MGAVPGELTTERIREDEPGGYPSRILSFRDICFGVGRESLGQGACGLLRFRRFVCKHRVINRLAVAPSRTRTR